MKKIKIGSIVFLLVTLIIILNVAFIDIYTLPEDFMSSYNDVDHANRTNRFGKFIKTELKDSAGNVSTGKEKEGFIEFKLFGFIPIRKVQTKLINDEDEFYIGGSPIGLAIETQGVIVVGENVIETENGTESTQKTEKFKVGDTITKINNEQIGSADDIKTFLQTNQAEEVEVTALRRNKEIKSLIKPLKDRESGIYKIGYWVRGDASGVGTLTYINKTTNKFGSLGHPITDFETGASINVRKGDVYECNLLGINKGTKETPGDLKCLFLQGKNKKGTIEKNTNFGVFGTIHNKFKLADENKTAILGGRMNVTPGKAKIVSDISGVKEEYEIEIIKANYQPKSKEKSFVFRVSDKRLLSLTGGIVQGMSGSPILQDGKLVGAVTHVFLNDPTKGYGIYIDWMVAENESLK